MMHIPRLDDTEKGETGYVDVLAEESRLLWEK